MADKEKVTSDALRKMAIGSTAVFRLPQSEPYLSRAANSSKSIAYRLQRELRCAFQITTDFDNAVLIITKNARV